MPQLSSSDNDEHSGSDHESPSPDDIEHSGDIQESTRSKTRPITSSLGLCENCSKIFSTTHDVLALDSPMKVTQHAHHSTLESLTEAARQGCYICSLLVERLEAEGFSVVPDMRIHCWLFHKKIMHQMEEYIFFYRETTKKMRKVLGLRALSEKSYGNLSTDPLGASTWSTESRKLVVRWLQASIAHPQPCTSGPTAFIPTRLLQVHLSQDGNYCIKLRVGATLSGNIQYFTLSHRWGNKSISCLLTCNIESFCHEIPFESISKEYQHAIQVTIDLGYNYIWIDSLCIIQDSHEDWLKEGAQMAQIYKSAICNIAASGLQDSDLGLFRTRRLDTFLPLKVETSWPSDQCRPKGSQRHILLDELQGAQSSLLNSRGWVLQEKLLSPQIISFGDRQLFYNDQRGIGGSEHWPSGYMIPGLDDCNNDALTYFWSHLLAPSTQEIRGWCIIAEDYSKTNLTYDTDKLAAISGIARELQAAKGYEYLGGLWKEDLMNQLLWVVCDPASSSRIQPYTAPTWSWASMKGQIRYSFMTFKRSIQEQPNFHHWYPTAMQEAQIYPALGHGTGPVTSGFLRLRGPLWQAFPIQNEVMSSNALQCWAVGSGHTTLYFYPDIILPNESSKSVVAESIVRTFLGASLCDPVQDIRPHTRTQSIFLLPIHYISYPGTYITIGLALVPTDDARGEFRRVGLFVTPDDNRNERMVDTISDIDSLYYESKEEGDVYVVSIV